VRSTTWQSIKGHSFLIIGRYIGREALLSTSAVVLVLMLIGISNQFVRYLADAARGEISAALVFKVVAMHMPTLLGLLLPLGLFLGVMLALSRLYAESELTALFACGFSYRQLMNALMVPMLLMTVLAGVINFWLAPHYMYEVARTLAQAQADLMSRAITPGRFQASDDGKYVLYIDSMSNDDKRAHDVFIAEQDPGTGAGFHLGVIASSTGYEWRDPESGEDYIVLKDGYRYQGLPGDALYQLMSFKEYGLKILQRQAKFSVKERAIPTLDLLGASTRDEQAELQWRICITLSPAILALLAIVVSRVKPRQGKYAKAFPGIVIAIIYINALIFSRGLFEDSVVPAWIGMYWVPLLGIVIASSMLWWQSNKLKSIPWVG
jgi:lipopolysaccharide export system permease protein